MGGKSVGVCGGVTTEGVNEELSGVRVMSEGGRFEGGTKYVNQRKRMAKLQNGIEQVGMAKYRMRTRVWTERPSGIYLIQLKYLQ